MVTDSAVVAATVIEVTPDFVVSFDDVAVMVAVPAAAGVNAPEGVIVPPVAAQVTAELYAPVPWTAAVHVEVWVIRIDAGEQAAATEVMVTGAGVTFTLAEPDLVESWVEVALIEADPEVGTVFGAVYSPEFEIVPELAVQVTAEL